jgi:membrane-associated phospholipid phosphatase
MTPPLERVVGHVRGLWPGAGVWLPLPFVAWGAGCILAGFGRWEHVALVFGVPLLAYASAASKRLFIGLFPMGLLGLVYDAMRFVQDLGVTADRVHVCDLRAIDMKIASVVVNGERGTVHDWIQQHPSTTLELIGAVPYGTFLFVAIAFAVYLYVKSYERMRLFGWAFLVTNIAGFITYHLYPAAPPWYFHEHGCAVDLAAHASEGPSLARVDALLGIHYFHDFYSRAADVFGAVPSLHVSYPMLIALFGWRIMGWPGRTFAIGFLITMCTAAVYLDHHWIFDIILGLAYAVAVYALVLAVAKGRSTATATATARLLDGDTAREAAP